MRFFAALISVALLAQLALAGEREDALAKAAKSVADARDIAKADPSRPVFHVLPEAYWTNDPNGPLLLNGEYHLFSQHNPYGNDWGHMHWAHYTSKDLVTWQHAEIGLWPSLSQGEEHCFSGSAILGPDGLPRMYYTSIGPKTGAGDAAVQWMALGDASGNSWQKWDKNPAMTLALHGDLKVRDWRDPYVWKEGNEYRCVLGGALAGDKGAAFIYASTDLEAWTFQGVLCEEPEAGRKGSWECPSFFRLGDKWVLLISRDGVRYFTGAFDDTTHKFTIEKSGAVDLDKRFYAPNGMVDAQGRHVLWGWVTGVAGDHWNGCLTLPRVLSLGKDGQLQSAPLPELSALRGKISEAFAGNRGNVARTLDAPLAPNCEIEISLSKTATGTAGVRVSNGATEQTFAVDWDRKELVLGPLRVPVAASNGPTRLQVFIDRSVIEVFTGDGRALTAAWPGNGAAPLTITHFSTNNAFSPMVKAWELSSIWR